MAAECLRGTGGQRRDGLARLPEALPHGLVPEAARMDIPAICRIAGPMERKILTRYLWTIAEW